MSEQTEQNVMSEQTEQNVMSEQTGQNVIVFLLKQKVQD